jgi:hypothetical protein
MLGGGVAPALLGTLLAWGLSVAVSSALAGRSPSPWRLTLAVLLSQGFFHLLFQFGTTADATAVSAAGLQDTTGGHLLHQSHGATVGTSGATGTSHAAHVLSDLGPAMLGGHLLATLATVIILTHGERVLSHAVDLASRVLDRMGTGFAGLLVLVLLRPMARAVRPLTDPAPELDRPLARRHLRALPHRGPPSFSCA